MSYDNKKRMEELQRASKRYKNMHASGAVKRAPVTGGNVLVADRKEGMMRRYCVDQGDNLDRRFREGYQIVENEDTDSRPHVSNTGNPGTPVNQHTGAGLRSYLLEMPTSLYKERQKEKASLIKERERTMVRTSDKSDVTSPDYGEVKFSTDK